MNLGDVVRTIRIEPIDVFQEPTDATEPPEPDQGLPDRDPAPIDSLRT